MIFKEGIRNLQLDLVVASLTSYYSAFTSFFFNLNFPTNRMRVVFPSSVAKGGFGETDGNGKNQCVGFEQ